MNVSARRRRLYPFDRAQVQFAHMGAVFILRYSGWEALMPGTGFRSVAIYSCTKYAFRLESASFHTISMNSNMRVRFLEYKPLGIP
jgi:hypothetical protein